jgi:NADH:ubiquinone oxidoreductase subunit D
MMCMEHSYVLAVEQLLNLAVPERAQYIRVLYSEVRVCMHVFTPQPLYVVRVPVVLSHAQKACCLMLGTAHGFRPR